MEGGLLSVEMVLSFYHVKVKSVIELEFKFFDKMSIELLIEKFNDKTI